MATTKFPLSLTVQYADKQSSSELTRPLIRRWVRAALLAPAELNIRFVDEAEGRELNRGYRNKNYATNVLTFAYNEQAGDAMPDSGTEQALTQADIILCSDVLKREADEQRISLVAHAAHLVVHGILHAQGYDHESDEEAAEMEQLETEILAGLGIADPYHPR